MRLSRRLRHRLGLQVRHCLGGLWRCRWRCSEQRWRGCHRSSSCGWHGRRGLGRTAAPTSAHTVSSRGSHRLAICCEGHKLVGGDGPKEQQRSHYARQPENWKRGRSGSRQSAHAGPKGEIAGRLSARECTEEIPGRAQIVKRGPELLVISKPGLKPGSNGWSKPPIQVFRKKLDVTEIHTACAAGSLARRLLL